MAILIKPVTKNKSKERRTERMNLRLPVSVKALLTEAAKLEGLSLSEYVLQHSMEAAHEQLNRTRYHPLSEADTIALAKCLDEATVPTKGLERAADTYHNRVAGIRE